MMTPQAREHWRTFMREEEGVTSIEYALLAGLIAVVIVASVGLVGGGVLALFARVLAAFP